MDNVFKHLFERDLGDERSEKRKKAEEFHATSEFLPDPTYDPQLRLKKQLRLLFPHLPTLPGLPPKTQED